jgi:hypothetical protein
LFGTVRERLARTAAQCAARPVNAYSPNIFKGKVFCGVCGEPLHRQRSARKKTDDIYVFHCLSNSRKARGSCEPYTMPERDLSAALMDIIQAQAVILMGKAIRLRGGAGPLDAEKAKLTAELDAARKEAGKDDRMLQSLYENLVLGVISAKEYHDMRSSYGDQARRCAGRAAALERRLTELGEQAEEYVRLAETADKARNQGISAELLDCLVERIRIFPGRRIEVDFRFSSGFELLLEVTGDA